MCGTRLQECKQCLRPEVRGPNLQDLHCRRATLPHLQDGVTNSEKAYIIASLLIDWWSSQLKTLRIYSLAALSLGSYQYQLALPIVQKIVSLKGKTHNNHNQEYRNIFQYKAYHLFYYFTDSQVDNPIQPARQLANINHCTGAKKLKSCSYLPIN